MTATCMYSLQFLEYDYRTKVMNTPVLLCSGFVTLDVDDQPENDRL